jgi:hypothetical protein
MQYGYIHLRQGVMFRRTSSLACLRELIENSFDDVFTVSGVSGSKAPATTVKLHNLPNRVPAAELAQQLSAIGLVFSYIRVVQRNRKLNTRTTAFVVFEDESAYGTLRELFRGIDRKTASKKTLAEGSIKHNDVSVSQAQGIKDLCAYLEEQPATPEDIWECPKMVM